MNRQIFPALRTAQGAARRVAALACATICVALLAACANVRPATAPSNAAAPQAYSDTIDISGRFSAQFEQNGRPQSWSGAFNWAQSPQSTLVTLLSPLGQTVATIVVTPSGATLTQTDKEPRSATNVDALVQDTLGWPLPISNLRNWMQARATNRQGQLVVATPQMTDTIDTGDGWRLRYLSWQDESEPGMQNVPKRIDMERDTAEAGRVQMRLVISTWQPH